MSQPPAPNLQGADPVTIRQVLLARLLEGTISAAELTKTHWVKQAEAGAPQEVLETCAKTADRAARTALRSLQMDYNFNRPAKPEKTVNPKIARKKLIRTVEDKIENEPEPETRETLHAEFQERLDSPELAEDLAEQAVDEIATEICRDLGLREQATPQIYKRRTPADIARLHLRAAWHKRE